MKKIFFFLAAIAVLLASASFAEDFSSLSDEDLMNLYREVLLEMEVRGLPCVENGSAREDLPAEGPAAGMVLYYVPDGGTKYHADQNCVSVHEKYLPMKGVLTYADLDAEEYAALEPCQVCGAPQREAVPPAYATIFEAVGAGGEFVSVGGGSDALALVMKKDGKYLRVVTMLDERAQELYQAAQLAEEDTDAFEAFSQYAWGLPVSRVEEFAVLPLEQAELDTLAGKTIGQLLADGFDNIVYFIAREDEPVTVSLAAGLYEYSFELYATCEECRDAELSGSLPDLTVKCGKFSGFSAFATDPYFSPDGTE